MKLWKLLLNRTALCLAIAEGNIEIIKILLSNENLDINIFNIFIMIYLIKFINVF